MTFAKNDENADVLYGGDDDGTPGLFWFVKRVQK